MWRWTLLPLSILAVMPACSEHTVAPLVDRDEEVIKHVVNAYCAQAGAGSWLLLAPAGHFDSRDFADLLSAHSEKLSDQARAALVHAEPRIVRDLTPWERACFRRNDQRAADFLTAVTDDPLTAWHGVQETEPFFRGTVRPSWLIREPSAECAAVGYTLGLGPLGLEERVVVLRATDSVWVVVVEEVVGQS